MHHLNINYKNNYTIRSNEPIKSVNTELDSSGAFHKILKELISSNQSFECSNQDLNSYLNKNLKDTFSANLTVKKAFLNGKENHELEIELERELYHAILEISDDLNLIKNVFQNDFLSLSNMFIISSSLDLVRFLLYQKLIYLLNVYKTEFRPFIQSVKLEALALINDREFWALFSEKLKRNQILNTESYQYKDHHFFSNYILKYIYQILIQSEYAYEVDILKKDKALSLLINREFPTLTSLKNPNEIHILDYHDKLILVLHRFDSKENDKSQSIQSHDELNSFFKNLDTNRFYQKTEMDRFIELSIRRYEEIENGRFIYSDYLKWYLFEQKMHTNLEKLSINPFHSFPSFLLVEKDALYSYLKQITGLLESIVVIRMTSSVILNLAGLESLEINKRIERNEEGIDIDYLMDGEKIDISMFESMDLDQIQLAERNGKVFRVNSDFKTEVKNYKELNNLTEIKQGRLKLSQFPYLETFLNKDKKLKLGADYKKFLAGLVNAKQTETEINSRLSLYKYQKQAITWLDFLYTNKLAGILADEMGLGKTIQVAAFIEHKKLKSVLILCPASIITNWLSELGRFDLSETVGILHPDFPYHADRDIYLSTYHSFDKYELTLQNHFQLIVFDEIQIVKNHKSNLHKKITELNADMKLGLTGTPLENSLMDLWSIFNTLDLGLMPDRKKFKQTFVEQYKKYIRIGATEDAKHTRNTLQAIVSPFVLRRRKSDPDVFIELPEKVEHTLRCTLTEEQNDLYKQLIYDFQQSIRDKESLFEDKQMVITLFLRLKQLCNHPAFIDKNFNRLKGRSGKLNELETIVKSIMSKGEKVIIFSQFRETCDLLGNYLSANYPILKIVGEDKIDERNKIISEFNQNDEFKILIMSLKTGGLGLNLTVANHVIHYDRWWNPAVEEQASDRVYRIGQRKEVHIYRMITEKTIEEAIENLIKTKKKLFEDFIEESDFVNHLTSNDLKTIIKDLK
jgi:SNF2 family DNA or RNA helicase